MLICVRFLPGLHSTEENIEMNHKNNFTFISTTSQSSGDIILEGDKKTASKQKTITFDDVNNLAAKYMSSPSKVIYTKWYGKTRNEEKERAMERCIVNNQVRIVLCWSWMKQRKRGEVKEFK